MTAPAITTADLSAIENVLGMQSGYVLDLSNRTFAMFFADLGLDVETEYTEGSKANRLRKLLRTVDPSVAARVLEALLEHRGSREGDETSPHLVKYRNIIARLSGSHVTALAVAVTDVLTLTYVRELDTKTSQRLAASDFEGAITTARTMLEAVLLELEQRLVSTPPAYQGDLQRLFKGVAKQLRIDEQRADLDDNFKQVVRGLVQVVNGLAPIRNKMSDGHPRQRKPAAHHARVIVNAAKTVATFLVESFAFQREKGLLPDVSPPTKRDQSR